ncbi:molecular chaperone [candidate division KSB1 bacterium 4484_87]|nr:MAG: molecular chaperone [candidate division KSB1 bacterium 4484_87]
MAIVRWRPFGELEQFRSQMDRLFDDFFGSATESESLTPGFPLVDIKETKDDFVITAEVPGMSKDDIKISLTNNTLTIKGEKKEEKKEDDHNYHRVERRFGSFSRSFTLDAPVEAEKIKAKCKDGILTITLPKKEESKPKEIPISVS